MADEAPWLRVCALPQGWRGQPAWRILDTDFGAGDRFFHCLDVWSRDPERSASLHCVALAGAAPEPQALLAALGRHVLAVGVAADMQAQCFGLTDGFHRIALHDQQVLLTLCIGAPRSMLRAQQCTFDSVWLDGADPGTWDAWDLKALARCCRRGTVVVAQQANGALRQAMQECGFAVAPAGAGQGMSSVYGPPWQSRRSRPPERIAQARAKGCIVVGAGLAGASVAAALGRRGWLVTVLDGAPDPAAGASGLPVGLCAPHVSKDDSPRSRLSRAGLRQTLTQARALLVAGADWQPSGLLERRLGRSPGLPRQWGAAGQEWSRNAAPLPLEAAWAQGLDPGAAALWHQHAAWIKPARLVAAWLARPGVRFSGSALVHDVRRIDGDWVLFDAQGRELGRAGLLVLAAAGDTRRLLQRACADPGAELGEPGLVAPMQGIRGQVSWGWYTPAQGAALPPFPVNGAGSFIAGVPIEGKLTWHAAATYEAANIPAAAVEAGHASNQQRLRSLLPQAAALMQRQRGATNVQSWSGVRQTTADRLPLLGPMPGRDGASLWLCSAMGSRGLTLAPLCAELLAAQICAEPLPVPARLAHMLQACRVKIEAPAQAPHRAALARRR